MDDVRKGEPIKAEHFNELRRRVEENTLREGVGYRFTKDKGGTSLVIQPPRGGAGACSAMVVSLDDSNDFAQTSGLVNSTGPTATGYTGIPTLIDGDTPSGSTTTIYLELTFDAVTTGSETTDWELSAAVFGTGTAVPSESVPVWGGSSWDKTTFDVAESWASYNHTDVEVTSTRCGNVTVVFCALNDIRIIAAGPNG